MKRFGGSRRVLAVEALEDRLAPAMFLDAAPPAPLPPIHFPAQVNYLKAELSSCLVTNFHFSATAGTSDTPMESNLFW